MCEFKIIIVRIIIALFSLLSFASCKRSDDGVQQYSAQTDGKVLRVFGDLKTEADHHYPHYYGRDSRGKYDAGDGRSHGDHNIGNDHWDNVGKVWENGGGSHHTNYDKYGNKGWKGYSLGEHRGFHDRLNDGSVGKNWEDHDNKNLWSRDRGRDHERDTAWDKELAINRAHSERAGLNSRYHNLDRGAHNGYNHYDGQGFVNSGDRGSHSGHDWRESDRVHHLNGGHNHALSHYPHNPHYHH